MTTKVLVRLAIVALSICSGATALQIVPRESTSTARTSHFQAVSKYVDSINQELWPINKEIHDNPELAFKENKAHKILTDYIAKIDGWKVERSAYNISTAFVATFEGAGEGPVVSFNAEYDALPSIGHACGHNLIAISSLAGALATADIVRSNKLPGKVVLFGTPAEELGGGKIRLLEAGAYSDHKVNISLMAHPGNMADTPYSATTAIDDFEVEYYGKASHAAASPWEGINAQDAMVLAYNALSMLRQQTRATDIIQGFIRSGGIATNIIPALSSASFTIRAVDTESLNNLTERVEACFKAGAIATGAKLNLTMLPYGYANMITNNVLADSYSFWAKKLGIKLEPKETARNKQATGSTDQGNVSHEIPSIHAGFVIQNEDGEVPETGAHTPGFAVTSGSRRAFNKSLVVAKTLAGVALDVLTVDGFLDKVKKDFESNKKVPKVKRSLLL